MSFTHLQLNSPDLSRPFPLFDFQSLLNIFKTLKVLKTPKIFRNRGKVLKLAEREQIVIQIYCQTLSRRLVGVHETP